MQKLAIASCSALLLCLACDPVAAPPPAAIEVVVAAVVQRDVPVTSEWIGTTEGTVDAERS
jgi:hypothetical protein